MSYPVYEFYLQEKMTKQPFVRQGEKTTEILVLVHTDVCSPFDVQVKDGYLYFIIFNNDYSRYGYVYEIF